MNCISCGQKTSTNWDGISLQLCSACSKEASIKNYNRKQENEELINRSEAANTFKFRTIIYILLGLIIPLWIITLPLFWYIAYRSYTDGVTHSPELDFDVNPVSKFDELKKLKELYDSGALTEEEFDLEKRKLLLRAS